MSTLPGDLHSALYFGDQRDFWWNADFLALMGSRLAFSQCRDVLDAGCGVGHWGRALLPHLPNATLVGVDREPVWVEEAGERARRSGISDRTSYRVGTVEALPFPDASFDLVTCQTVLIHVPEVGAVLREFLRVLRPGGLVLVAEPNNLSNVVCPGSARHLAPVEEKVALLRFQLLCERGKAALGEGDNSVGELLPGFFAEVGFESIAVWQSDRAASLLPPYASPAERAMRADFLEQEEMEIGLWPRATCERYFLAGGGRPEEFEAGWNVARAAVRRDVEALRAGRFHTPGGAVTYLVAGRRPLA